MKTNPTIMAARERMEHKSGKVSLRSLRSFAAIVVSFLFAGAAAHAQVNSGSNGSDGAFNPTTNIVINMADHPDGIYQYTSVNIPNSVTVTFIPNANNSPVIWLVQGSCVINGTVNVSGNSFYGVAGGLGGPGGYGGGSGQGAMLGGFGPGGGPAGGDASYGSLGATNGPTPPGIIYGNSFILPLLGGSGGGGSSFNGYGGGGGGGAILIAAPNQIQLNGYVHASGGSGYKVYGSRHGSGGAIRLVATSIAGSGGVYARGPDGINGNGRVRFDALQVNLGAIYGTFTQGFQPIIIPAAGQGVQLSIASVAGVSTPANPKGLLTSPDVVVSAQTANSVPVVVRCSNIPLNSPVTVFAVPAIGPQVQAAGVNNAGTLASSTATINLNLPRGGGLIYAQAVIGVGGAQGASVNGGAQTASYAQTGLTTGGERFVNMEVTAALGGPQQISYLTESGKKYPLPTK